MMILADIGPSGGAIGLGVGVVFFLIVVAVAYIAFRMLRKTVKLALRLAIVTVILVIGSVGTLAFFYMGSPGSSKARPAPMRRK